MADTNQHGSDMAVRSIPRLILSFTATTLAALLFNSFYTLTDTLFISRGVGDLAIPMLAGTAFQAVGRKLPALFLYAANLFFLFPLVLIFAGPFGISGIWWAYVLASTAAAVPAAHMLFIFTKKHVK